VHSLELIIIQKPKEQQAQHLNLNKLKKAIITYPKS